MGWIKEWNKKGQYVTTYKGFRIYRVKDGSYTQYTDKREDGEYLVTHFINPEFVAVNKSGDIIKADGLSALGCRIDFVTI
jgi:hypothetical protein